VVETCVAFSSAMIKIVFEFEYSLWSFLVKNFLFLLLTFQWGLPSIRQILPSPLHSEEEYPLWYSSRNITDG
jgi:hypothetical protein